MKEVNGHVFQIRHDNANGHMKVAHHHQLIMKPQIDIIMKYHFILLRLTVIKKGIKKNHQYWRGSKEKVTLLPCWYVITKYNFV